MAETAKRQVSIFINGKEVEGTIKAIAAEQRKLNNELANTALGTEEYEQKVKQLQTVNAIIDEHRQKVRGVKESYDLVEGSLESAIAEQKKLTEELARTVLGTEEYEQKVKDLKRVNGVIDEHNQKVKGVKQAYGLISAGVGDLIGLAAGAFTVDTIIGYGKQLFNTGVQMDSLVKKAKVVFGDTLPLITAEAEQNAAAMGLTNQQYIAAAANIQDLLVPMGFQRDEAAGISGQLVNLSGALSEWTGGQIKATEVANILQDAVLGEREELKQLGISISQADVDARVAAKGLGELTGAALQQAEAAATLELILEKSTDAQAAFANGSGSLVRQQAEAAAKFQEISEKLATALLPVFDKLLGLALSLANGLGAVANGIESLLDPAGAATEAFDAQAATVNDLTKNVEPLLARYDELSTKSNLSAKEQDELQKIITTVSNVVPSAVTQFDEYGRALGLNTDKAREFIEVEKARLRFINKEAADAVAKQIKDLEQLAATEKARLDRGTRFAPAQLGQTSTEVKLTDNDIREATKNLSEYQRQIQGARAELARLNGENLKAPEPPKAPDPPKGTSSGGTSEGTKSNKGAKKNESEVPISEAEEKALGERLARMIELQKQFDVVIAEARGNSKAQFLQTQQEELDALTKGQRTKLDLTLNFEAEKAAIEEQIRLELRTDKQVELDALNLEYALLLEAAQRYGIDVAALKERQAIEQAEIEKKYADKALKEQYDAQQARLTALQSTFQSFGDLVVSTFDLIGGEGEKSANFQKVATLAKIAFDTAAAISSLVAASNANPANAVTFGAAGIAQYVSGIARIIANIAQAKKVLSQAPPVVRQKYEGGPLKVVGQTDKRTYNALPIAPPDTGLLPGSPVLFRSKATGEPVLASERGTEYFVSAHDMQKPYVANLVRMIDLATKAGRGVSQFAEGGTNGAIVQTSPTPSPPGPDMAVLVQLQATLAQLVTLLNTGIVAVVPDNTVIGIRDRLVTLNEISGGYYS